MEITITWNVEDIQEAAKNYDGRELSEEAAEEILMELESVIQDFCISEGWDLIDNCIGDFLDE